MTNDLTSVERIAFYGLMARKQLALAPILEDEQEVVHLVEERMDLPRGAIGTTHNIGEDAMTGALRVVEVRDNISVIDATTEEE